MALNILVVDDSKIVRQIVAKTMQLARIPIGELHQAGNGKEALEILAAQEIDLVVTDINMPVMGGTEMIERMGREDLMQSIPVIVISTEGSRARIDQLNRKGIRAYLRKPVPPEQIRDVVQDIVEVSHGKAT